MSDAKKDFAVAYGIKRRNTMAKGGVAARCPECMAQGGRCMAHGGEAKAAPSAETIADRIMAKRRAKMADGGPVLEDDFEKGPDFSLTDSDGDASTTGEPHDADDTDEAQAKTLVGQILRKRRAARASK